MSDFIYLTGLLLILFGCSENQDPIAVKTDSKKEIIPEVPKANSETRNLDTFQLDWFSLKSDIRFLNCGARIPNEKLFIKTKADGTFLYEYCAHNGNQQKDIQQVNFSSDFKLIEAIVLKSEGEIGHYSDQNETLQFLQSYISNESLGAFNWVDKDIDFVTTNLGIPDRDISHMLAYTSESKCLILKYSNDSIIRAFKYYPNWNGAEIDLRTLK